MTFTKEQVSIRRKEQSRQWRLTHKEYLSKKYREWYTKNFERQKINKKLNKQSPHGRYKYSVTKAKQRGLIWTIPEPLYILFIQKVCSYCGNPLEKMGVGLDRINNKQGYSVDNVVPCCKLCNIMKNNLTQEEFFKHILKIVKESQLNGLFTHSKSLQST